MENDVGIQGESRAELPEAAHARRTPYGRRIDALRAKHAQMAAPAPATAKPAASTPSSKSMTPKGGA